MVAFNGYCRYMMTAESGFLFWFRLPGEKPAPAKPGAVPTEAAEEKTAEEPEALVLCRRCGQAIARPGDRTVRDGSHQHTFANPHGIVYEILCFQTADGCTTSGPATDEFTWFKGYRWRVAVCRACVIHLGWHFASDSGDRFFGLISDRLIFPS